MSDYLVNLARRSAGIAPVARPRSGPGPGPMAGTVRGGEQPSISSTPARSGPVAGTASSVGPAILRSIEVEPSHDEAARTRDAAAPGPPVNGPTRVIHEKEPTGRSELPTLRLAGRASAVERVADAPAPRVAPEQHAPTGTGPSSTVKPLAVIPDHAPEARLNLGPEQNGPAVEPRRDDLTVELPLPRVSAGARRTDVPSMTPPEPVLAPAPLGGPRTVIDSGPGREVHVRIGTIEIHAETDAPAVTSLPAAATPAAAVASSGGFDEFVRLRSYAPWER